jgi:CrcB protein
MNDPTAVYDWSAIAAGGAVGAVLRGLLARLAAAPSTGTGPRFDPAVATLVANLTACALLGGWTASAEAARAVGADAVPGALSAFVTIGLCGSLSTFSTLCADAARLLGTRPGLRGGGRASAYLLAHLAGGPLAWMAGAGLAR